MFKACVLWAIVLAAALLPLGGAARAQSSSVTLAAQAGFDGFYKDAMWIPIRITLSNQGADVSGAVKVSAPRYTGSQVDYIRPVELPNGSRKEIYMYVAVEGYVTKIDVSYVVGKEALATSAARAIQIPASDMLYAVLASSPTAFNILTQIDPVNGKARVAQIKIADLPPAAEAWKAIDVLVISDVDTGQLSTAQVEAMSAWVADGGRLVLAGGPNWQKVAAGVSNLLPLIPIGTRSLPSPDPLAAYAQAAAPEGSMIAAVGDLKPGALVLAHGPDADGRDVPLIVEQAHGFGRVDFLAFDPAFAPLDGWRGMDGVYRSLLSVTSERPGWSNAYRNWYNAGEAVNAIPGIGLPHVLQVVVFLVGYIAVVGPLNFVILRRLKRPEWAWASIPAIVLLFTGLTYLASYTLRGTQPTLHRLTVAQVWENSDRAQVESLIGIFSPRRAEYDLQVEGDVLLRPLPSDTFYGSVDTSLEGAQLEQSDAVFARHVRVDVGAIKPFVAQGQVAAPTFRSALTYSVAGTQAALQGTVSNLNDFALRDAVILTAGGFQRLGDIAPGGRAEANMSLAAARATSSLQNANPVLPPGVPATTAYLPGYYSSYDSTVENVLGTVSYYENREIYRRYSLLTWLFDPYNSGGRGSGTYLVGWADTSPIRASLVDQKFNTEDETMFIIRLQPEVVVSSNTVTLPPGLMVWQTVDPGFGGGGAPYDSYISQGYFALRFKPAVDLDFRAVSALTLHLNSYGASGPSPLVISLWDQNKGQWVELTGVRWGDTAVSAAGRFVGSDGRIEVRVENKSAQNSVSVEALDFTLVVQR